MGVKEQLTQMKCIIEKILPMMFKSKTNIVDKNLKGTFIFSTNTAYLNKIKEGDDRQRLRMIRPLTLIKWHDDTNSFDATEEGYNYTTYDVTKKADSITLESKKDNIKFTAKRSKELDYIFNDVLAVWTTDVDFEPPAQNFPPNKSHKSKREKKVGAGTETEAGVPVIFNTFIKKYHEVKSTNDTMYSPFMEWVVLLLESLQKNTPDIYDAALLMLDKNPLASFIIIYEPFTEDRQACTIPDDQKMTVLSQALTNGDFKSRYVKLINDQMAFGQEKGPDTVKATKMYKHELMRMMEKDATTAEVEKKLRELYSSFVQLEPFKSCNVDPNKKLQQDYIRYFIKKEFGDYMYLALCKDHAKSFNGNVIDTLDPILEDSIPHLFHCWAKRFKTDLPINKTTFGALLKFMPEFEKLVSYFEDESE